VGRRKPYSEFGKLLDSLTRKRDVRGPYAVAEYINERTGRGPRGQSVSQYFYGEFYPRNEFIVNFADAFELNNQERFELAWTYAYGVRPKGLTITE
jgi:hypothetical protein